MIISPLQFQWPENALECLGAPTRQARRSPARTGPMSQRAVTMVRIETLLYRQRRQLQDLPPDGGFQRLQIQAVRFLAPEQRFDIPQDLSGEEVGEQSFF